MMRARFYVRSAFVRRRSSGCGIPQARWAIGMCLLFGLSGLAHSQDFIDRAPTLKAAFLVKFGNYVTWPDEAFPDERTPFVIGALGESAVASPLREIGKRKLEVQKHPLAVRIASKPEELAGCHIVYLSDSLSADDRAAALRALAGKRILLVGDWTTFLAEGGVLQFVVESNRLAGYVNQKALRREGLKASSELLTIFRPID
jgi:hypothetical protein